MIILPPLNKCYSSDDNLHITKQSNDDRNLLAPFITKLLFPSTSLIQERVSLLAYDNNRRIFVVHDDTVHIYDCGENCWLEPPLSCGVVGHIFCISTMPYTDTVLVATDDGVYAWTVSGIEPNDTENSIAFPLRAKSSFSYAWFLKSTKERTHSIRSSPQGSLFATLSLSGYGIGFWTTELFELIIWGLDDRNGTALCLPREDFLYSKDHPSAPVFEWSPSGEFIAIGTSNGSVYIVDTEAWNSKKCCHLHVGIACLCWVSPTEFVVACEQTAELYTLHVGGRQCRRGGGKSLTVQVSSTPISVSGLLQTSPYVDTQANSDSSIGDPTAVIGTICAEINCQFMAVSFVSCMDKGGQALPLVALLTYRAVPFLSLSFIRVFRPISEDISGVLPRQVAFCSTIGASNSDITVSNSSDSCCLCILWSSGSVSIETCAC